MFNHDQNEDPSDDDAQFYRETVYNEDYYVEQENELINQSNLELELEKLEDESIREMRVEGLLRPTIVNPGERRAENGAPAPTDDQNDLDELSF